MVVFNGLDDVLPFQPLNSSAFKKVVALEMLKINDKLKPILISYGDDVIDYFVKKIGGRSEGARLVRRYIEKEVEDVLVETLLKGKLPSGKSVLFKIDEGKLTYEFA